ELHCGAVGLAEAGLAEHAVQDVVPAGGGGCLVVGVGDDVVLAGCVDEGGEVGGAGRVEVGGVPAVVGLGGGLDAVGVAAEVAGVEVALEDLVLGLVLVQLDGDEEFLGLAGDRLFLGQVVVLDVLLGDGGAGLLALAGGGVPAGADHGLGVDGGLGVEVAVLGGQYGVLGVLGDLGEADVLAVDLAVAGELGAVGV